MDDMRSSLLCGNLYATIDVYTGIMVPKVVFILLFVSLYSKSCKSLQYPDCDFHDKDVCGYEIVPGAVQNCNLQERHNISAHPRTSTHSYISTKRNDYMFIQSHPEARNAAFISPEFENEQDS